MTKQPQYAIYVTEQPIKDASDGVDKQWHHTALWLVAENEDGASVVQQLHFNNYSDDFWEEELGTSIMVPNVRDGLCKSQDPEEMMMTAVVRGNEMGVLAQWNHMLKFSKALKAQKVRFDLQDSHLLHANNCRAGVIAALKTIGVKYDKRLYASEAGTHADRIKSGRVIMPVEIAAHMNADKLWEENHTLAKSLQPPWEVGSLKSTTAIGRLPLDEFFPTAEAEN